MTQQQPSQDLHDQVHPSADEGFAKEAEQAWKALVEVAKAFKPQPKEVSESG